MEMKCVEEGSLELHGDDTAEGCRRESSCSFLSDRRESTASSDRRESTASAVSDRRDSVSESEARERMESCGSEELEDKGGSGEIPLIDCINELLVHLPLLHNNNVDTKMVYLAVIAKVGFFFILTTTSSLKIHFTFLSLRYYHLWLN